MYIHLQDGARPRKTTVPSCQVIRKHNPKQANSERGVGERTKGNRMVQPSSLGPKAFKNIQDRLSIGRDEQGNEVMLKDSQKIVVPRGAQDKILKELHRSHSRILKTYTTAAQLYYWPGMRVGQAKQAKNNSSHVFTVKLIDTRNSGSQYRLIYLL